MKTDIEYQTNYFTNVAHGFILVLIVLSGCTTDIKDIAHWQEKGDYKQIIKALNDVHVDTTIRTAAARALGEARHPQATEALVRVAENSEEPVDLRVECVHSLGWIGDELSLTQLKSLSEDYTQQLVPGMWAVAVQDKRLKDVPLYWIGPYLGYVYPDPSGVRPPDIMNPLSRSVISKIPSKWSPSDLWEGVSLELTSDWASYRIDERDVPYQEIVTGSIVTPLTISRFNLSSLSRISPGYNLSLSRDSFVFMGKQTEAAMLESWGAKMKQLVAPKIVFPIREAAHRALKQPGLIVFKDNFDNNRNNWSIFDTTKVSLEISQGKYFMAHKRENGTWFAYQEQPGLSEFNFEVECEAIHTGGVLNSGYGIVFGLQDAKNFYSFEIAADGHYIHSKCLDGKWIAIIPWTESSAINKGDSGNRLAIRRRSEKLEFLINDQVVNSAAFETLPGDRAGFMVEYKQTIAFDDLIVRRIK